MTRPHAIDPSDPNGAPRRDEGSVLPMILALMVIGSLGVVALLTFATTLFTNRPPIEVRDGTFWTAKSAMSMAMTMQREAGPDGCYQASDTISLNGYTAAVTCTATGNYFGTGRGRFGVITTGNDPVGNQLGGTGVGAPKPITGDVFVNGGSFGVPTADVTINDPGVGLAADLVLSNYASTATPANRYEDILPATPNTCDETLLGLPVVTPTIGYPNAGTDWAAVCQAQPWWHVAGDLATSNEVNDDAPYDYPELPPLPAYTRPSVPQAVIGSCKVYFPGRYDTALTLGSGEHYFPSGVYYFEKPVTLEAGAKVVAGEGRWGGCTFDAEAAFAPTAPTSHSITGKGATFLLGGDAQISATNASLRINRRVSDSTSRGTETIAIRSVNYRATPTAPQAVEIPDDVVHVADVFEAANPACNPALSTVACLQRVADHSVKPIATAAAVKYKASTMTPANTIISFIQTGGTANTNQLVTDGYVFVPNSKVLLRGGTNTDYRLRLSAGVVASSLKLEYTNMPSNPENWFIGVLDEPIQRQVELNVSVTAPNGQRTVSKAIMEVNIDGSYAINGWTVDPNAGTITAPPTTPTTTTTTTTLPPTTTSTTTTTTTTLPPTTTTTTTLPPTTTTTPPPVIPSTPGNGTCDIAGDPGGWNRNFGSGNWTAEYWNWGGSRPNFNSNNPFSGSPSVTAQVANVAACGSSSPHSGVQSDDFSARFTKTINLTSAQTITFLLGGDDGIRLRIDGNLLAGVTNWSDHAHEWKTATTTLAAGTHTLVVEFYENGGSNTYQLWRN